MTIPSTDLFSLMRNAILDLQAADYQTISLPLKKLGRLLSHPELSKFNLDLSEGLDVESFIEDGLSRQSSMIGSARLEWPDDDKRVLGFQLLLVQKFCNEPEFILNFGHQFFHTGNKLMGDVAAVISQIIIPFERDYRTYVRNSGTVETKLVKAQSNQVFLVHGHDEASKQSVARFVEKLGLEVIILHERANKGRTLISKFREESADVGFAIVLITPDDFGAKNGSDQKPRARQNVVFELGFFIGALGPERVCALVKGDVEKPSDFEGVAYVGFQDGRWQIDLAKELKAVGYSIDMNLAI
jgi:predicted nucleotide-binding protein